MVLAGRLAVLARWKVNTLKRLAILCLSANRIWSIAALATRDAMEDGWILRLIISGIMVV